ncbi:response regulator transcription factor [Thermodesulfobacteriota bacterium]
MGNGKKWILMVEDDITSRIMMANQMHRKGFEVICAEDGEQAAEIIKYCTPDCILLDLMMPRMHGHAFLSLLREKDQKLPVLIMSAITDKPELVATMESVGIQGWISKPINPDEMEGKINKILTPDPETGG